MSQVTERTLLSYLNSHGAYDPASINGQKAITFLANKTGVPQVWKVDRETGDVRSFAEFKERILCVNHAPSGKATIIGSDNGGDEKQQFYVVKENGEIEELVLSQDHFHYFGGWSPDERKIAFASNRRHPGYFDVYVLDLETKQEEVVYPYDGNCTPICWTKNGEGLIISLAVSNIDNTLYILDIDSGETRMIGNKQIQARYHSIRLTKDGKTGYLVADEGKDTLGIFQFSLEQPEKINEIYAVPGWDIEELSLSPEEDRIAFTVNEGGSSQLGIYTIESNTVTYVTGLPVGVYESISWSNQNELLLGIKSAILPGDIWIVNLETGQPKRLTFVGENKEVGKMWLDPELCSYTSFDGLEVPYFLYGKKGKNQPVMIYVHGGPESQIRNEYNPVIQFLAAQGYAVVAPNVRGSMGYGRNYVQLDDVRKRMDAVADLKWLVEDLVTAHGVNSEKVGIMGRSYGGFMVLAAITHYPDLWSAAVDIVGISHFKTFLENTGPWRRRLREKEYGSLEADAEFFEEIAPLNYTSNIKIPLLIFHGRNDTRVPVSEAEQLTQDLQKQGKKVELIIFDNEGHQTEKLENHILMNRKIVEFMEEHL